MRVILRQDVENLGIKGDIVDVAPGFGRNYLIPKRLAIKVTSSNMKMIEIEKQALKKRLEKERLTYQELIQKLNQVTLSFRKRAAEKDIIFGSVSSSDIKDALLELGFEIDKKKILLQEPIKRVGNYSVSIKIFQEEWAEIKVEVIKEEEVIQEEKKEEVEIVTEEKKEEVEEKKEEPEEEQKKEEVGAQEEKKEEKEKISEEKVKEAEGEGVRTEREEQKEEEKLPEEKIKDADVESKEPEKEKENKEEEKS